MAVCRRVARDVHPRAVNDARLLRGVVVRATCIWWSAMYCGSSSARCSGGSCSYCRVDSVGADHHLHVVTGVDGMRSAITTADSAFDDDQQQLWTSSDSMQQ